MNLKQMKRELDALIRTVKTAEPMADVRFIKEYSGANAEMPVRGWIGVVRLCELSAAPRYIGEALCPAGGGKALHATVEIMLYAPAGENGSGLTRLSLALLMALRTCPVRNCQVSAVRFDPDFGAIYRRVGFEMTCGGEAYDDN